MPRQKGFAHIIIVLIAVGVLGAILLIVYLSLQDKQLSMPGTSQNKTEKTLEVTEPLPWVEDSLTQPLPENASSTRLSLPVKLEDFMPNGAPIVGFGAHNGQHVEGLDHPWVAVKKGEPARAMGDGTVINIGEIQGQPGRMEYMIYIDYGDGLMCSFGEIDKPLVTKGQKVKYFDPVGEAADYYQFDATELEIYCADSNRTDGIGQSSDGYHTGAAVSPFDYLNEKDKKALEQAYTEKILNPHMAGQGLTQSWAPADPLLTNKVLIHEKDKIIGEWFLVDKTWNDTDYSLVVFLPANKYHDQLDARLRIENAQGSSSNYIDAPYSVEYSGNKAMIVIEGEHETIYALAEVTEGAGKDETGTTKAQMKFETSNSPISEFSGNALTYQERGYYNPRYDAWKLGNWVHYQ